MDPVFFYPGVMFVQVLGEEEKVFKCVMHNQEVTDFCQDVMQMSQLQRDIAKNYGLTDLSSCLRCININEFVLFFFY